MDKPTNCCHTYRHCGSIRFGDGVHIIDTILASGKYPEIADTQVNDNVVGPGSVGSNAGHLWGSTTRIPPACPRR